MSNTYFTCKCCGVALEDHHDMVTLSRSTQRVRAIDADLVTEYEADEWLDACCAGCGIVAVRALMAERGLQCIEATPFRTSAPCAKGCGRVVAEDEWHIAYSGMAEEGLGNIVREHFLSPVCRDCEKPLSGAFSALVASIDGDEKIRAELAAVRARMGAK